MLQNNINPNAPSGEKFFANVMQELSEENPSYDFRLYAEPNGKGNSPDFGLYSNNFGLIYFEVKDFSLEKIINFDHHHVVHTAYNNKENQYDFDKKQFFYDAIEEIRTTLGKDHGVPVSMMYVFPNIYQNELAKKTKFDVEYLKLNGKEEGLKFIFADDLNEPDSILNLFKRIRKFPPKKSINSKGKVISLLSRKSANPIMRKNNDGSIQTSLFDHNPNSDNLIILDSHQVITVNKWLKKRGYRFLKGHAGTGKTVVLASLAEYYAENNPSIKILITYFTSTLSILFSELVRKYPNQIKGQRIVQFCKDEINNKMPKTNSSKDWSKYAKDSLIILENNKEHHYREHFDYIFVDEGQDFSKSYAQILFLLAKGKDHKEKNIVIAYDDNQSILEDRDNDTLDAFKGKQIGRVKRLDNSYRTPKEIGEKAGILINEKFVSIRNVSDALSKRKCENVEQVYKSINKIIESALDSKEVSFELKDIAIIYPSTLKGRSIDDELNYIDNRFRYKHRSSKNKINRSDNYISILSSRYAKGLEFKLIFLIHFDLIDSNQIGAQENLYVSLTRTLYYAFVMTTKENKLIDSLFN